MDKALNINETVKTHYLPLFLSKWCLFMWMDTLHIVLTHFRIMCTAQVKSQRITILPLACELFWYIIDLDILWTDIVLGVQLDWMKMLVSSWSYLMISQDYGLTLSAAPQLRRGSTPLPIKHQLRREEAVSEDYDWTPGLNEPATPQISVTNTQDSPSLKLPQQKYHGPLRIVLLGQNGVGKSSLALCLAGLSDRSLSIDSETQATGKYYIYTAFLCSASSVRMPRTVLFLDLLWMKHTYHLTDTEITSVRLSGFDWK